MVICNRPFDDGRHDFEKMWRFLQDDIAARGDEFIWLVSRLGEWKYGLWREKKYFPTFFRKHAQLWLDKFDRLHGFVLSEDGDDIFFICIRRGYEYLYQRILDWTIEHWGSRYARLRAEVHEYQADALAQLGRRGFHSLGPAATTRKYDLAEKAADPVKLPTGFHIVTMQENGNYRRKALVNVNGFGDRDEVTELDLLRFEYSRENPAYDPGLDFSVVTADGAHVASCVGFCDPAFGVAEVEKVCTHNQYRRLGLAEAVIRECFHRLHGRGIGWAYITGYSAAANGLYEKLGSCGYKQWFQYEMPTGRG